jgi:two-component system, OmpR family, sensor histidine kinase BaeS
MRRRAGVGLAAVNMTIGLAQIAELGGRVLTTGAEEVAAVTELVQRTTGVDITVVSEITDDDRYVFAGIEKRPVVPVERGASIPYAASLCSRVHVGEAPDTIPDIRAVPAFWEHWLDLKAGLGVDWDVRAFCTRDIRLPDGARFGTLCIHHLEPRAFSRDEQALLELLARIIGLEVWRERSAVRLNEALVALGEAERQRVELAEELRHELRAPLQVIDGYAEGMLDGVVERDDEHVTLLRHEAGRAIRLLDDITELVRIEVGEVTAESESVRVDATVTEMRDRLAPLAAAIGIELVTDTAPMTARIARKRLEQLIVNLIRNSLRAMQDGGGARARIFVRPEPGFVAIGVEDDGPGMVEDELARVFDRFYRGSSDSDAAGGSGLGLTIARRIVEAANGEIRAENLPGRGLRVTTLLPLEPVVSVGDQPVPESP